MRFSNSYAREVSSLTGWGCSRRVTRSSSSSCACTARCGFMVSTDFIEGSTNLPQRPKSTRDIRQITQCHRRRSIQVSPRFSRTEERGRYDAVSSHLRTCHARLRRSEKLSSTHLNQHLATRDHLPTSKHAQLNQLRYATPRSHRPSARALRQNCRSSWADKKADLVIIPGPIHQLNNGLACNGSLRAFFCAMHPHWPGPD